MESLESTKVKRTFYKLAKFNELTAEDVYEMCKARYEVFVCEQEITCENDFDDKDKTCLHLFTYVAEGENVQLAGYCRLLAPGVSYEEASIGRVLVLKEFRGLGIAKEMMEMAIQEIKENLNVNKITLSAQSYIKSLYESVGFKQVSEEYEEAEIPHVKMKYSE